MRYLIEIIAGYNIDLSNYLDLTKIKINRLWTVFDEKQMWESSNIEPKTLENLELKHRYGVFIEDQIHDWSVKDGMLCYYSRLVKQGESVKILIEC